MGLSTAFIGTKHYNKYGNKKITTPDGVFDSKYEYEEWCRLKLLERAGIISHLRRQVQILLIPNQKTSEGCVRGVKYYADFMYIEDGKEIVIDTKGYETDEYKIKKKILLYRYPDLVFIERKKGKADKIYYERRGL